MTTPKRYLNRYFREEVAAKTTAAIFFLLKEKVVY